MGIGKATLNILNGYFLCGVNPGQYGLIRFVVYVQVKSPQSGITCPVWLLELMESSGTGIKRDTRIPETRELIQKNESKHRVVLPGNPDSVCHVPSEFV